MTSEFFNKRLTKIQFQIGLKRFARLKRLRQVCDQIVVFWEEKASRFPPSPRHCEIYDQLSLHGSRTNLARQDLRYAIDCVFYGAGKDRPALYHQVEITTFVAEHLCNAQVESLVRNWCRGLFNLWPSDPQIFDLLALPLERFRAFSPTAQNLSQCHLNSLDAPRLLEQTIKPNDLVNEVQLKKTDRLSLGFSRFSNCLWENSLSRYGVLVEASRQNKCSLAEALAFIRSDSVLPSHTLRNLDAASAFVQSVLMPYNRQSGNFPSQEDQDQFWRFFEHIFGETDSPEAKRTWDRIAPELKELIEHWKRGRALIMAFTVTEELLIQEKVNQETVAARQWQERLDFWRSYWNRGLVTGCRLFIRKKMRFSSIVQNYLSQGGLIGEVKTKDALPGQVFLAIELHEDVLVMETNFNGAMRITNLQAHPEMNLQDRIELPLGWRRNFKGTSISHQSGWQSNAERALSCELGFHV